MIVALLALAASGPLQFPLRMNEYLACLSIGLPADLASRDQAARGRLYRAAAAHCVHEREVAIEAAVHDRRPGQTAGQARALAIDIIDTLDPFSSSKVR